MNAIAKPRIARGQGQRTWTDAQRAHQAALLRARQIWIKSTGPRTLEGKAVSSRNARHADYEIRHAERTEMRLICTYLRTQKSYTDLLRYYTKQQDSLSQERYYALNYRLYIFENELIDIERQMFGGMRFHEICGFDNRPKTGNIYPINRHKR